MDKGHGVSNRLSTPLRQKGGDRNAFLNKSSKKEKLKRLSSISILSEMDQLSHSNKKFLDHCGRTHHTSAPKKPRSAMKKRENESEHKCTKEEEEVAEALFELAQTFNKTSEPVETVHVEPPKPVEIIHVEPPKPVEIIHVEPPNEADVMTHGNKSRKRCWVHVYICHFIKADVTSVNV